MSAIHRSVSICCSNRFYSFVESTHRSIDQGRVLARRKKAVALRFVNKRVLGAFYVAWYGVIKDRQKRRLIL